MAADKLIDVVQYVLAKVIKADMHVRSVRDLNEDVIIKLKEKEKIEGIILDVDDTLRRNLRNIPECNKEWIDMVGQHLKIIVMSNGRDFRIKKYFEQKGIDYISFAHKPLKENFMKACESMRVEPSKVLVVGNSLYSDIHGGRKNNMKTVLVEQVEEDERGK